MRHTAVMSTSASLYHRHRFPTEIISHCVWLYFRFALSFRDVEELLAMRGVSLSYETVREWCLKFGQIYANDLRRKSSRPGDQWHLDEVFLRSMAAFIICGEQLIRMATFWIFSSKANEIREPPRSFSANC
jgi:transposase-like protein